MPQVTPHINEQNELPQLVNHYVRKSDITASIVEGISVKALCGEWGVFGSEGGFTHSPNAPTCPLCGIVYAGLPA